MSGIAIRAFGGVKPKIDPHLLPDTLAQTASNCRITSGALSPWRALVSIAVPTKAGTKIAMYRINYLGTDYWLHWTTDVNMVKSQLPSDAYNRYYYTGDGVPQVTNDNIATTGAGTNYPLASYTLGLPAPTTPTFGTIAGGVGVTQTRSYVYTLVSAWGEEGPPSAVVTSTGKVDDTWTVNLPQVAQPGGGTYQVATKNLYRTVLASDGTSTWLLVASGIALATASYADSRLDAALVGGTILPSTGWIAPPTGLSGLIALPNGSMAGFVGNRLCLSEPYQPHAWPVAYQYSMDFNVVGIAANGNSIVACTTANPYIWTGTGNAAMTPTKGRVPDPCLSKRSVVDVGWGVLYASPNGLVNALSDQSERITDQSIIPSVWLASYFPSTMIGALFQGMYHGYYSNAGAGAGLIVDRASDFGFKQITDNVTGAWVDPLTGLLYVIIAGAIYQWDANPTVTVVSDWKSKVYIEPKPLNYGAIQVEADFATVASSTLSAATIAANHAANAAMLAAHTDHGELGCFVLGEVALGGSLLLGTPTNAASKFVSVTLYAGGVLKWTQQLTDNKTHKLPSGYKHNKYEIEVAANVDVYSIKVAENSKALQRL